MIESKDGIICVRPEVEEPIVEVKRIKLTEEDMTLLKENFKFLEDNLDWFKENSAYWENKCLFEEWYPEWYPIIDLIFPEEDDYYTIEIDNFNTYIKEFKSMKAEDNLLITPKFAYLKVIPNYTEENFEKFDDCWKILTKHKTFVSYQSSCFIPALEVIKEGLYDEERGVFPSYNSEYLVVEYNWEWNLDLKTAKESIIIYKYLLASKFWISFTDENYIEFSQGVEEWGDEDVLEEEYIQDYPIECINDYVEAQMISNPYIRYTLLFRILEYISVSSNHAELLNDVNIKLEEFSWKNIEWTDIKEIVWIIKNKKIANDYIKTLLDIISIESDVDLLPTYIKGKVVDGPVVDIKKLSSFITNTRHKYSHANPNYNNKGNECRDEDVEEFNIFMDRLVQKSIDWYISLDDYLKIK